MDKECGATRDTFTCRKDEGHGGPHYAKGWSWGSAKGWYGHVQDMPSTLHRHTDDCWAPVMQDDVPSKKWRYCTVLFDPRHPTWSYFPLATEQGQ